MVLQIYSNISRLFVAISKPLIILSTVILSMFSGKNAIPTPTPTSTLIAVATPSPTSKVKGISIEIKLTPHPAPTSAPQTNGSFSIDGLKYPGASTNSESENILSQHSPDSPDKVTSYYKTKIEGMNPKSKAFAQTSTNGQVENKLAYSDSGRQITVEIKSSGSGTDINVTRD